MVFGFFSHRKGPDPSSSTIVWIIINTLSTYLIENPTTPTKFKTIMGIGPDPGKENLSFKERCFPAHGTLAQLWKLQNDAKKKDGGAVETDLTGAGAEVIDRQNVACGFVRRDADLQIAGTGVGIRARGGASGIGVDKGEARIDQDCPRDVYRCGAAG